jgi:hypothetical protein
VLPYTRFVICLLEYDYDLHIVNFAILYYNCLPCLSSGVSRDIMTLIITIPSDVPNPITVAEVLMDNQY